MSISARVLAVACSFFLPHVAVAQTKAAVEYYYPAWNYYFVTSFPSEIAALDSGAFGGVWQRTGQTFPVWSMHASGTSPVCRFFSTSFAPKSSHFYTPFPAECDIVKNNRDWQYEAIAFYLKTPDGAGNCPAGTAPLYRLYNNGIGGAPNHRYTTGLATRNSMVSLGWIPEGYGPSGVISCVAASGAETSYTNFKGVGLTPQSLPPQRSGVGVVRAYGNFSGSGQLDLFAATLTYWPPTTPSAATPAIFEFWRKETDGSFVKDSRMLASADGCVHPRKAIVADFNSDGQPDVFVACHGFDAPPFPGERNKVVLSQSDGTYTTKDASPDVGFFHSASAADLNGDGIPDVIVTNNFDPASAFVLLNQGGGVFEREASPRLPSSIGGRKTYFSVELVDVDGDGTLDVVLGGHEWQGAATVVLLNPGSSNFTSVTPVVVPPIANEGVVLDFVVTGSGSTRALWLLRTSGGDGTFYQSRTIQKVLWPTLSSTVPLLQRPAPWFQWIIPTTVNEQSVIASEDGSVNVAVPQ